MSVALIPVKHSFIQFEAPRGYGDCDVPTVQPDGSGLPMLNPKDLSFEFVLNAPPPSIPQAYRFGQEITEMFSGAGSISGSVLTITAVAFGAIWVDMPVYFPSSPPQVFIVSQLSGTPFGIGTYQLNIAAPTSATAILSFNFPLDGFLVTQKMLGTLGARVCLPAECEHTTITPANDFQWIATGCAYDVNNAALVFYFQPTGMLTEWNALPNDTCFNVCIYELGLVNVEHPPIANPFADLSGIYPYGPVGSVSEVRWCSSTQFYKIFDECEEQLSSVLKYSNVNDAFGFYYTFLGPMVQNINFLNSIRLPIYINSPEYAIDEQSYAKSDGSTKKLMQRIWTDYKLTSNWMNKFILHCLQIALAHDYIFITCHYEGIDHFIQADYEQGDPTQFVCKEALDIEWKQDKAESFKFKFGKPTGKVRIANPNQYVNTNCY